jgi:hypothetical protein
MIGNSGIPLATSGGSPYLAIAGDQSTSWRGAKVLAVRFVTAGGKQPGFQNSDAMVQRKAPLVSLAILRSARIEEGDIRVSVMGLGEI